MNGYIFILEIITDIQNPGSNSIHRRNSNVDYEGSIMCKGTVVMIKQTPLILGLPFSQWHATNLYASETFTSLTIV